MILLVAALISPARKLFAVVKANVAELLPAVTVTEAGTEMVVVSELRVTTKPLPEARPESVTVHVPEDSAPTFGGEQVREVRVTGATRDSAADCEMPLRVAVTVAVWLDETERAVALKVAEEFPADTVTEAGVESTELLSEIATARPPEGAAWESVKVQMVEPLEVREVGAQAREVGIAKATRDNAADCEVPLRVAVTVAD